MPCQFVLNCSACSAESFPSWVSRTVVGPSPPESS